MSVIQKKQACSKCRCYSYCMSRGSCGSKRFGDHLTCPRGIETDHSCCCICHEHPENYLHQ